MEVIGVEDALEQRQQRLRRVQAEEGGEARQDERSQGVGAASSDLNPMVRWVKSQNGRVFDWPQRHKTKGRLSIG